MSAVRVLVVDDESQIHRFLRPALTAVGYEVQMAENGRDALRLIATAPPDVVVLDLGLPDMDGKDILREVRSFSKIPIIILSARDHEMEKILAFDAGADDYVEKPFAIGELMARLRTALRHAGHEPLEPTRIEICGLCIDFVKHLVTKNDVVVKLTPKEYDILEMLAKHSGRLLTHRQLLTAVWGPAHEDDTQYLRVYVGQLRAKIEEDPSSPRLVLTEPCLGYRFAEVGQ